MRFNIFIKIVVQIVAVQTYTLGKAYLYGLNPSTLTNRSIIYQHLLEPLPSDQQSLDVYNFSLVEGYHSTSFPTKEDAFSAYNEKAILHMCPEEFFALTNVSIRGAYTQTFFNASYFLALISNKNLFYIGDSLSRQAFLDISSELTPFQSLFRYGSSSLTNKSIGTSTKLIDRHMLNNYMRREYNAFNATISYCNDPQLRAVLALPREISPCLRDALQLNVQNRSVVKPNSTILILGPGAWFKPLFSPILHNDYMEDMEQKVVLLARTSYKARLIIRHYDPNAIVLWKLPVHMGLADELSHIDPQRKHFARGKAYVNGWAWSNTSMGALWPPYYGQVLKFIAKRFNDTYLDSYRVSYLYLRYFEQQYDRWIKDNEKEHLNLPRNIEKEKGQRKLVPGSANMKNKPELHHPKGQVRVHTDSLHYCPGSIFRGEMYLVQAALSAIYSQQT